MWQPGASWLAFEAADEAAVYREMSFAEALARFERLWWHARAVRPDLGDDWRDDVAGSVELARVLNGLPAR